MVNRSWACLTWCHIPYISDSSWLLASDFCWGIIEDGVQVSWGHLWRCYVDYDWFERAPFEGASVPSAVGAQTWIKQSVSFHKIRVKWVQRDEVRVQGQSSENLLGIKPWLSVGVGLGRSLIGFSIGPLALEAHISNTSISEWYQIWMVSSLWYEANLKVFKVIIHMPLLVHGLHSQILFGLVRALNVVIVPASTYL